MTDQAEHTGRDGEVPLPARWFHLQGNRQYGPVDLAAMRELVLDGVVAADTYVWADGMPDWMPAGEVPALVPPAGLARRDAQSQGQRFVGPDPVE